MRNVFNALLVVVIILLLATHFHQRKAHKEDLKMIETIQDSVNHWKDEYGKEHAKTKVVESQNLDLFTKLESSNETVKELQKLVKESKKKKNLEVATVIKTVTKIDTLIVRDKDSSDFRIKDKYLDFVAKVKGDSLDTKVELPSYLKLTHRYERKNIFSKKYLVVDAVEENPHIKVEDVRSIRVPIKQKRWHVGPYIGVSHKFEVALGVGLTYSILSF